MKAEINHVSIGADDLSESVRFYTEVFGAEVIATPNFGHPVQWLRLGALQLHVFQRGEPAAKFHHFALAVDDFETVYWQTHARGMHDTNTMGSHLNQLPSGQIQLYLRDPGGNLVEVDSPSAEGLSERTRSQLVRLIDRHPQDADNLRAHLDLPSGD